MVVRTSLIAGIALAALVAAGCGGKLSVAVKPNQPPVATLIVTRLNTASADSAAFELKWSATVARGRIDHYLIAIDPHSLAATDPAWQATRETRRTFGFSAAHGIDLAKRVHDCLGRALSKFVIDAAHIGPAQQN